MKYKGYTGIAEFDEDSGVIFGRVTGLRDVITFQGDSAADVTAAFHDSVDDYLEFCASRGESPEKPFSGQLLLRLSPELHRALSNAAEAARVSLNSLIQDKLQSLMEHSKPTASPQRATEHSEVDQPSRRRRRIVSADSLGPSGAASGLKPKPAKKKSSAGKSYTLVDPTVKKKIDR
jgi:predicted HicB family RNase H-like nuclease